jgi:UDP-3-O-[3-hydroxymyristoyl] glucosamine N-acyltransferase
VCGDADLEITDARPLSEAQPGAITFVEDDKHVSQLHDSPASAAVVPIALDTNGKTVIQVADPWAAFVTIVHHFHRCATPLPPAIDPRAAIHPTAQIGEGARIEPFACIGEGSVIGARCCIHSGAVIGRFCRLGDDVTLYPHAVLYDETVLGNHVVVHANAVLGADGFGYRTQNGRHAKMPQLGHVEIGDDVEVGACTTIDRGTFQATRVGEGTKIDNQVQVGHNCQIGRHNLLVSQVGIAGSCTTGDYVVLAGQVGIVDHVHIGDRVVIGGRAAVTKDVAAGQRMLGAPATPEREQKRILMSLERLPDIRRDVQRIKHHLGMKDE